MNIAADVGLADGKALTGKAPYSGVITHGFVLDERGLKMSKSLGNVVDPATVIGGGNKPGEAPSYGADVLRLWVSSVDYTGGVMIGSQVLRQMSDINRKLRGTLRFLLANLHDWEVCWYGISLYGNSATYAAAMSNYQPL